MHLQCTALTWYSHWYSCIQLPVSFHHPTGAWFYILDVISKLSVVTNAFLIAVTSQFIPFEVYTRGGYNQEYQNNVGQADLPTLAGYVNWSVSPFEVDVLFNGSAFPALSALELQLYNGSDVVTDTATGQDLLYLPFINYTCLNMFYPVPRHNGSDGSVYMMFSTVDFQNFLRDESAVSLVT